MIPLIFVSVLTYMCINICFCCVAVIETKPFHKFSIPIKSEGFDDGDGLACQLVFTYTAKYPDEMPVIEIENEENFDDVVDKDALLTHLIEQVGKFSSYNILLPLQLQSKYVLPK